MDSIKVRQMLPGENGLRPPHPLRLLLVVDSLNVGGAERHVIGLASALIQQGHCVTLACSVEGALKAIAERSGVLVQPLLHHLVKRRLSLTFTWRLARLIRQNHFDLVHAHMYASSTASAYATLGTSLPLVITEHSEANWRSWKARLCSRWAYSRARHIIAVSKMIQRRLIEEDGVPDEHVSVIMNGLSPAQELPGGVRLDLPAALRKGPLVGVIARLQSEKGVVYFLEAAAHVLRSLPQVHFLVVGDGPLRKELQAYAELLGLQEHIHFLGFRLDARAIVGLLDVLVLPSLSEGTPLVTLEAMAAGIPVVASAVGGIPEQIRHDREGLLVPPGDSMAISAAILQLLQRPARMQRLGKAGRRHVFTHFSFASMVRETERVYHKTLGREIENEAQRRELYDSITGTGR